MSTQSLSLPVASPGSTLLLALACGVLAAGSYLMQPILAVMAAELGIASWQAGLAASFSQLGFCLGLLLIVPLGDLLENRRLLVLLATLQMLALAGMACGFGGAWMLTMALLIGLGSAAVQLLVPLAAHLSAGHLRGKAVGSVTAGLLLGVLLARPLASLVTQAYGWRTLYAADALLVAVLCGLLAWRLPRHQPAGKLGYPALLRSLILLLRKHPTLRRRSAAQACLFAAFSLFWIAIPVLLGERFALDQGEIALFALAGAAGALAAPLAGRLADRGKGRLLRRCGAVLVLGGFALSLTANNLPTWVIVALLVDAGVQVSHVAAQRQVLELDDASRNRLNGLYIAGFFLGGASGSSLALPLLQAGWPWLAVLAITLATLALTLGGGD